MDIVTFGWETAEPALNPVPVTQAVSEPPGPEPGYFLTNCAVA